MANYYDILGVSKNSSEEEIKKAYKKAAIKWHPDRWSKGTDEEKKNVEEKFKEISEAYETLSDPQKKQHYDMFGSMEGFGQGGFHQGFNSPFGNMDDIFNMFSGRGTRRHEDIVEPGNSYQYDIELSIEEVFNGCEKEIECEVEVRCEHCHGEGGEGVETCPHCHGTGMITEVRQQGFMTMQTSHPCQYCGGSGKKVKNKCKHCNGTGLQLKKKTIKAKFRPGVEQGTPLQFTGMGGEAKNAKAPNGDIWVIPHYKFDQNKYRIHGRDVYELIDVNYYDCIIGKELKIVIPSHNEVKVNIPKYSKTGTNIKLSGKGINGGNYIFVVNVVMPTTISKEEEKLLKEIQELHK